VLPPVTAPAATVTLSSAPLAEVTASLAPVVDQPVLDELLVAMGEGGELVLAEFITTYLGNATELVANLEKALAEQDAPTLQRLAHTFKSSSASLGAMRVSALARSLEGVMRQAAQSGASPDWPAIALQVSAVRGAFEEARGTLQAIADRWGQPTLPQ
jgi:HPt (histidine-containing phosphotransfer) domain-containing protein